jgi:putative PIN family toxin of toxin-antitoxin system
LPRAVLDPNVLISAIISSTGAPAEILDLWRTASFELVVSERLLAELDDVLHRARFRRWINAEEIDALIAHFRSRGLRCQDAADPARIAPDPKDDYLIELAQTSRADALVTGDISLRSTRAAGVEILTPREFVDRFSKPG